MNRFLVGAKGDQIVIMVRIPPLLERAEALELATWILAIGGFTDAEKAAAEKAVHGE